MSTGCRFQGSFVVTTEERRRKFRAEAGGTQIFSKLLATEGCVSTALGARVRQSGSKLSVTDGPFTEAKEMVGGFAILKVNSKQEAIELATRFLQVAGEGE